MTANRWFLAALAALALGAAPARGEETKTADAATPAAAEATDASDKPVLVIPDEKGESGARPEKFLLAVGGRIQWLAVAENLDDPFRSDDRLFLFMKQARLRFRGHYEDVLFDVNTAYGGEDTIAASPGVSLGLLDFAFDAPFVLGTRVKVGQFRVPYGRERITDAGTLDFGDRSIQANAFSWNRDVGIALHARRGNFAAIGGIFTGGGRDVPQRYLPEKLGTPMLMARVGYDGGLDADLFELVGRRGAADRLRVAAFVNGLFIEDSHIGHSTVLNVRSTDKSLLLHPQWNPYVAKTPLEPGTVYQVGGDAVVRFPLGPWTLSGETEVNYGHFENAYGEIALKGGRLQAGVSRGKVEATLRYAVLYPDERMANTYTVTGQPAQNTPLTGDNRPLREITPSLVWHYRSNIAVVADLPILVDAIVFTENKLGNYVATSQPDQASLARPGFVGRQTVKQARLMFQLSF